MLRPAATAELDQTRATLIDAAIHAWPQQLTQ
jgi:hypothetical protein